MKKLLAVLLLVLLALSINAYAGEKIDINIQPIEVSEFTFNDFEISEWEADFSSVDEDYVKMINGIKNCDGAINFILEIEPDTSILQSSYDAYAKTLGSIYFDILYNHPELMQAATSYNAPVNAYFNDDHSKIVIDINFTPRYVVELINPESLSKDEKTEYLLSDDRDDYLKETIPPLVKKAILHAESVVADAIKEDMTDEEKILLLHDFVIDHTHYNTQYVTTVGSPSKNEHWQNHTAFGVFNNHSAVCQGYTLALNLLLTRAGIENKYVSGTANGGGHAWSVVNLDGEWYHVDPTHDDPSNVECIDHSHFLLSDSKIYSLGHTSWNTTVTCNSEKYRDINYCFHDVNPKNETIHYNNGYFYAYRHLHLDVTFNSNGGLTGAKLMAGYGYDKSYTTGIYGTDTDKDGKNDVYYVLEYVKSNFDGSEFELISKEEYDKSFIKDNSPEINAIYVDETGKAHDLTIDNVGEGTVFVRMVDETVPDVYVAFYDEGNKLIKLAKPELLHENAVEIETISPDCEFAKVSVFAWVDSMLKPLTENLVIE